MVSTLKIPILSILLCGVISAVACAADLICCGGAEVFIIDPANPSKKKWSWQTADSPSIPERFRKKFRSTDECKPYEGGLILVTSSSSGVALIERRTKKCLFLAEARNAHSACLLPNGQVAIAASFGGDKLQIYDLKSHKLVQAIPLPGGHGAVWDVAAKRLWALGNDELISLQSKGKQWMVTGRWELPSTGGHDLSPVFGEGTELFVTSNTQVLVFNQKTKQFRPHKDLGEEAVVKSVDQHPETKLIVYHQGGGENWWSDTIRQVGGKPIRLKGERLYKVRWDAPMPMP